MYSSSNNFETRNNRLARCPSLSLDLDQNWSTTIANESTFVKAKDTLIGEARQEALE